MTDEALPPALIAAPPIAAELDEALLAAHVDATLPDAVQGWQIDSLDAAEWAARRLIAAERRADEVRAQAEIWREPIDRWETDELARLDPAIRYFTDRLRAFALVRRADDERHNKTTRLPSGEITTRSGGEPKVVVEDEAAVIAWAKETLTEGELPAVVKKVETVLLPGLRAAVAAVEQELLLPPAQWEPITGVYVDDPANGWTDQEWGIPISQLDFGLRASLSTTHVEQTYGSAPLPEYQVVHKATGELVPGCGVERPGPPSATVKVVR